MSAPLHDDDPARDGNLTPEEYEATYADGEWCGPPAEVIEQAIKDSEHTK